MLKYAEINILDITGEDLDNTIEHIRWLSHSWTSIFLRERCIESNGTYFEYIITFKDNIMCILFYIKKVYK